MTDPRKPLTGVKVVEFGSLIAAPFATRLMADFGADVTKIEPPEGDPLRRWRRLHNGTSLWWYVQSRGKRCINLNLKDPVDRDRALALCLQADIVVENFRPGVLEKLGLGWEVLSKAKPSLVLVRISGFGQTGPYRDLPGFGAVGESMGGLRYVTGFADRPPVRTGVSIGDSIAALYAVMGALMALRQVEVNGGKGQVVDVALYEAVFAMMESLVPEYDHDGFIRERSGNIMPGITPSNTHTTRDGHHLTIGANGDAIFVRLMRAIGRPDLADDPSLADNAGRDARRDEIYAVIDQWVAQHDHDAVMVVLKQAEVPASKVYSIADMMTDPQFIARDMFMPLTLPDGKVIKMPGIVPRLTGA
jgi:formyl-CoA transferase